MRRFVPALLAVALLALLVGVTVAAAGSTDRGALGQARAIGPLPGGTVTPPAPIGCTVAQPAAGTPALTVSGACHGTFAGRLACTGDEDALSGSLQAAVTGGRLLTLSVIVPAPHGAGSYPDAAIYVQLDRVGGAERWSDRETRVVMDAAGLITVRSRLAGEVGTGSPGSVLVHGTVTCLTRQP